MTMAASFPNRRVGEAAPFLEPSSPTLLPEPIYSSGGGVSDSTIPVERDISGLSSPAGVKANVTEGVVGSESAQLRNWRSRARIVLTELGVLASLKMVDMGIELPYSAGKASGGEAAELRRWIAERYTREGIANPADRQADGTFPDPYADRSTYYRVLGRTGDLLIGARIIETVNGDPDTLQIRLNSLESVEQQKKIRALGARVGEFATYVKKEGIGQLDSRLASLALIKCMVQDSLDRGITHHVFGLNPKIAPTYSRLFGNAIESLGPSVKLGNFLTDWKPFLLDLEAGVRNPRNSTRGSLASRALSGFFGTIQIPPKTK